MPSELHEPISPFPPGSASDGLYRFRVLLATLGHVILDTLEPGAARLNQALEDLHDAIRKARRAR